MRVSHLDLVDFRNYRDASVAIPAGCTVFVGSNGQGKTNLVEAIGYLASGSSHRVSTDQALIRQGADRAIVRARVEAASRAAVLEIEITRSGANRAQISGSPTRPRELTRYLSSILFAPEDLVLVRGEPGGRRRVIDELLAHLTPRLAGVLSDYERVVRQRTTLLKSARSSRLDASALSTLDVWDERLVALGSEIIAARLELVTALRPHMAAAYAHIAGIDHETTIAVRSTITSADLESWSRDDIAAAFAVRVAERRREELDRAVTLTGPHRDDLEIVLNGLAARSFASHGESWSLALALRLASAELVREQSPAGDPVLVLDDVFAELDASRRVRLADAVAGFEQVLVTAAVDDDVPGALRGTRIGVRAGKIVEQGDPA